MENMGQQENQEQKRSEMLLEKPSLLFFIARHAEPAKKSIFDQLGTGHEPRSDNFEESSLTLKGILDSHLLSESIIQSIAESIPAGKLRLELLITGAYRTKETLQLIAEGLQNKALAMGKKILIDSAKVEELLLEENEENPAKSAADINRLIDRLSVEATESDVPLVAIGVTHEAKMRNYLNEVGIETDEVETAELIRFHESKDGNKSITYHGNTLEI
jgi:hypothetical protein